MVPDTCVILKSYKTHLKQTGEAAGWAAAKNKLLSASMKVLSTVGWVAVKSKYLGSGRRKN